MSESTSASHFEDTATLQTSHRGLLMLAVMGVTVIQFLDVTIANVALPHMKTSLGGSIDTIPWVLTSYIIAGVMVIPAVGWVSSRFGSRNVYLVSVAAFIFSSMLCGMATTLFQMILFRSLQGICAAFIGPMSQTIVFDINPPSRQPAAVAMWGAVSLLAPICGPVIGGILCESLNWRWVFYINVPIGIPTLMILFWLLPSRDADPYKLDKFGMVILALGLVSLQLMLDRGQHKDWFDSLEIYAELIIALGAFWVFFIHTSSSSHPLFPRQLFSNRTFVTTVVLMFVLGLANIAIISVLPIMYQNVWGYGPMDSGMLLAPRGFGVLLMLPIVTRLIKKVDIRYLLFAGFSIVTVAMWMMSNWTLEMGPGPIVIAGFIQGMGLGLTLTPVNQVGFSVVQAELRPYGSSLMNLMRNIGGSFGISIIATLLARNSQTSHADIAANITSYSFPGTDLVTTSQRMGDMGVAMLKLLDLEINRQALMIAYLDIFYLLTFMLVVMGVSILMLKPIKLKNQGR